MNTPAQNPSVCAQNPLLADFSALPKSQLAELALAVVRQQTEVKAEVYRIEQQISQARQEAQAGLIIDFDWMRRARYALHKKSQEAGRLKFALRQLHALLNAPIADDTEQGAARREAKSAKRRLQEEQLRTVSTRREQEAARLRLAALKAEEKDSVKFMRAARHLLDAALYGTIAAQAGLAMGEGA